MYLAQVFNRKIVMKRIIVTTTDLKRDYEIIGPLYFHISNRGFFNSRLSQLIEKYDREIEALKSQKEPSDKWRFLYGDYAFDSDGRFEKTFYIAVREMEEIARQMKADAIIGLRQDIKLNIDQSEQFYLQMYGTAVRFKPSE